MSALCPERARSGAKPIGWTFIGRSPRCSATGAAPLRLLGRLRLEHAAADLVFLDRLEQGLEVALAEAVVPFARHERDAALDQGLDGVVEIPAPERHVLDALALVLLEVLLDLPLLARILVDGDADLAVGAGHGA